MVLGLIAVLATFAAVHAQPADTDASGAGSQPGGGRHHGGSQRQQQRGAASPANKAPVPVPEPRQRLDAGALLCRDEASLTQHQAAVEARLSGGTAPEPAGCRIVGAMTAVSVLARDGGARTEIRIPGDHAQTGWTDAVVRDKAQ
jgi:hypothetical protein